MTEMTLRQPESNLKGLFRQLSGGPESEYSLISDFTEATNFAEKSIELYNLGMFSGFEPGSAASGIGDIEFYNSLSRNINRQLYRARNLVLTYFPLDLEKADRVAALEKKYKELPKF